MSVKSIIIDGFSRFIPDWVWLKLNFKRKQGYKLNLCAPETFNEKLQWLKLHNRCSDYTIMVDKYAAKDYVANRIGEEYIIPTIGVWERFKDINFDLLPEQFVLKCTHNSGGIIICKDKNTFDRERAEQVINDCLKHNFFWYGREWPYKKIKPRIIAEKYLNDSKDSDLKDYKIFCFNGKVKCFKVDFDRFSNHRANYYDRDLQLLDFGEADFPPDRNKKLIIPNSITQMFELAASLAKELPFVRVDFYDVNGRVFFGEITFFPASGYGRLTSYEWDLELGSWINLKLEK